MRSTEQLESREVRSSNGPDAETAPNLVSSTPASSPEPVTGRRPWFRTVFSFLVMLTMLVVAIGFMMENKGIQDPDIWWHLRNAEYLFQHHELPRQDLFPAGSKPLLG